MRLLSLDAQLVLRWHHLLTHATRAYCKLTAVATGEKFVGLMCSMPGCNADIVTWSRRHNWL